MPPWANGKNAKEYRATMGNKPVGGIFSVGVEEAYRWKDSVQSEAEIRIWVADGVANGLRPWFTKFAGVLRDRRWLERRRGPLPLAPRRRAVPAERGAAGPGRPGLLAADRLVLRRPEGQGEGRGPRAGLVPGAGSRPASRSRWSTTGSSTQAHLAPVQDAHPAEHRRPVGRAMPAAPRVRRAGRRAGGDLRDVALRRVGRAAGGLRPGRPVRGLVPAPRRRADAERLPAARGRPPHRPPAPAARRPRRRAPDHPRDLPARRHARARVRRPAADAHPELPRPADGDGLPARPEDRRRRGRTCARSARAGSSTSPGTSTASSGRSWPSTTASCSATPCGGRRPRSRRSRSRAPACST